MGMVFRFRMLSDEQENFMFDFEVPNDMTMLHLHNFIVKSLNYDPCQMASFFVSDSGWNKLREFTLLDMGEGGTNMAAYDDIEPPVPMSKIVLRQTVRKNLDRLIYTFDFFNERQYYLELVETKAAETDKKYPHIVSINGDIPVQFAGIPNKEAIDLEIEEDFLDLQEGNFNESGDYE